MEISPTQTMIEPQDPEVRPGEYYNDLPEPQDQEIPEGDKWDLSKSIDMLNIAEQLEQDKLDAIGQRVLTDFNIDKNSRAEWEKEYSGWIELAMQAKKEKNFPFKKAANVKYPIVSLAAIQFSARALPAIINNNDFVKGRVIGSDKDGSKAARAARVGEHMSFQLSEEMETWQDEMDEMLLIYSIVGTAFKKTYKGQGSNVSEMVSAYDLVVNYWAKNMETAQRVSHRYDLYPNEYREAVLEGKFIDIELGAQSATTNRDPNKEHDTSDEDAPHEFIEQHRWWDLDDDGYKEPYVVTICSSNGKVVRISARFDADGIKLNDKGEIKKIIPVQYFTQYTFLYSPDGSFYRRGFGSLVGSSNDTINTIINQLLDAGTMANAGGGFISSGIQFGRGKSGGPVVFTRINEWMPVNFTGDDLRKAILPLPVKDPSMVLFNLLGTMIESAKELTSQTDILSGNMDRQEPATTTLARIEQGLKVFSSIYLRLFRSLKKEYVKLFRLNSLYLEEEIYRNVLDEEKAIAKDDYRMDDVGVKPAAAPNSVTDAQKMFRAQVIFELRGQGMKDDVILRRYLESHNIPDVEDLFPSDDEEKPPTADQIEMQMRMKEMELEAEKIAIEHRKQDHVELMDREKLMNMRADTLVKIADAEAKEAGVQLPLYQKYLADMQQLIVMQDEVLQELGKKYGNSGVDQGGVPTMASEPDNGENVQVGGRSTEEYMPANGDGGDVGGDGGGNTQEYR